MRDYLLRVIVPLIFIVLMGAYILNVHQDNMEEMEVNLGKKLVLGGDTLKVVDYSYIAQTYTLSNGTKVSKKLVEDEN